MPDRPNILWICTDQQRADTLGCTGNPFVRGEGELYDLDEDPDEACNRFFDPEYHDVKLDMLSRLTDRMAFTADPLPERRARW